MKQLQTIFATAFLFLLAGCGTTTQTTFRAPVPVSGLQQASVARTVDSVAKRLEFTDYTDRMRRNSTAWASIWSRAYHKPSRDTGVTRIWAGSGPDSSMLVFLYQTGSNKTPDYIAAEAALTSSLRRLFPELLVESHVQPIPM